MNQEDLENFDITIIGGSIAGNYLSFLLSNSNLNIAIIEEHKSIGYPFQCAGIVSKKLGDLIDLPKDIILNRVEIAKLISPMRNILKLSGDEIPYIIDRVALDKLFYEKVRHRSNIHYFLGEKFRSFEYNQSSKDIIIQTSRMRIKSKMLIGCDGPLSSVTLQLGVQNQIIYATQIRIKADFNENEAVMYFDETWNDLFGWVVPEGKKVYRVGLACSNKLSQKFQRFLKRINIDYTQRIDQQGGIIPIGVMNKLAFDNVLFLGDAAGQVKATTGGGIVMLLKAAKIASKCILKSFKNKDFSEKFIKKHYQAPCEATLGKQLKIHYLIRIIFQNCSNQDFETLFKILGKNKIKEKISLYGDMDFPRDMIIKLIFDIHLIDFLFHIFIKNPSILIKIIRTLL